jgi:hypothetical protein
LHSPGQPSTALHLGSSIFSTKMLRGHGRKSAIAFRAPQQLAVLGCFQVPSWLRGEEGTFLSPGRAMRRSRAGIACTRSARLLHPRIAVKVVALPKLSARCQEETSQIMASRDV